MSFGRDVKGRRLISLVACACVCAVFLSSCGKHEDSQQDQSSAPEPQEITVTTAADKTDIGEATDSSGNEGEGGSGENDPSSEKKPGRPGTSGTQTEKKPVSTSKDSGNATKKPQSSGGEGQSTAKTTTSAQKTSSPSSQTPDQHKGIDSREYLLGLVTDSKIRAAARSVMEDMQAGKTEMKIDDGVLKEESLSDFMVLVSMLEAESYIIPSPYSYIVNKNGYVTSIKTDKYPKSVSQYKKEKEATLKLADDIVAQAEKTCSTQFEKAVFFHDYIINNCTYDLSAPNGGSAYGCLVEGRAVCEGYAKAMSVLCSRAGIECIPVTGHASYEGNSQSHMWNLINIDGVWTHVDTTWDDIESAGINACGYSYFGLTDKQIKLDHSISPQPFIKAPSASLDSASYYIRKGYYISSEERMQDILKKAVDEAVKDSSRTVTVRCADAKLYEHCRTFVNSEGMIGLLKEAKEKRPESGHISDSFMLGDSPNSKSTYTIVIFLKYDT